MKYYEEQNTKNQKLLNEQLNQMPEYVRVYFNHVREKKSKRSRSVLSYLQYSYDYAAFFSFVIDTNPDIKEYKDVTLEILENFTPMYLDTYSSWLDQERDNDVSARARKISALRSLYNFLAKYGHIQKNPAAVLEVPANSRERKSELQGDTVVALDEEEMDYLLYVVENALTEDFFSDHKKAYLKKTHARDVALFYLLLGTGMRVSECVGVDLDDLDLRRNSVIVHRKGGITMELFFSSAVADALKTYINGERSGIVEKSSITTNALFLSTSGKSFGDRMTTRTVERTVEGYTKVSVKTKHITCHKLRSTYATRLYLEGVEKNGAGDLLMLQSALGHANLEVLKRYTKQGEYNRRRAGENTKDWF